MIISCCKKFKLLATQKLSICAPPPPEEINQSQNESKVRSQAQCSFHSPDLNCLFYAQNEIQWHKIRTENIVQSSLPKHVLPLVSILIPCKSPLESLLGTSWVDEGTHVLWVSQVSSWSIFSHIPYSILGRPQSYSFSWLKTGLAFSRPGAMRGGSCRLSFYLSYWKGCATIPPKILKWSNIARVCLYTAAAIIEHYKINSAETKLSSESSSQG